jgi:putative molybdopterin biosynthesis protein
MTRDQEQFLEVVDRDTAEGRWWAKLQPTVLEPEPVALTVALGRVLAEDAVALIDVPPFDRANVDGFAVQAQDTFGAADESPRQLAINPEEIVPGRMPIGTLLSKSATAIATGAVVPRGADAVVMIEHVQLDGDLVQVIRPVAPGSGITFAGTDIARGERILRAGTLITSRETAILAAIGRDLVSVIRRPRVAIVSTGDELVSAGKPLPPAAIYDSNAPLLADAVRELGGDPLVLGIVADDGRALEAAIDSALARSDVLIMSGGTSKGAGDLSYRVLAKRQPGIIVHGVALKPGKPICLGAVGMKPVVILPGFPTSAIFTFHEFVAPLLRCLAGRRADQTETTPARMPFRYNSEVGRTEYLLVSLVDGNEGRAAYPLGKGSGSVTTFSLADGFITIPANQAFVEAGESVDVFAIGRATAPANLVAIGSHCTGLELLLSVLHERGVISKTIWVGSQGGLLAVARGECDIAGVHLLDPETNDYNRPFLPENARLLPGYSRMQGIAFRHGDPRFLHRHTLELIAAAATDPTCRMVNRNRGSGTRILFDRLLDGRKPPGYAVEARSHNAVAAAIVQERADWGLLIAPVAAAYNLAFIPVSAEHYDFAIPANRWDRPAVIAFRDLLADKRARRRLVEAGFQLDVDIPI